MSEDIRTITYRWFDDTETHTADIVVGDGMTVYDENYDYDQRIFFYFHDEAEYEEAKRVQRKDIGFMVLGEEEN
jgi:hypothetical protein